MSARLSQKGLQKISELQDKYHFMTTFEIVDKEDCIEFLENIHQAKFLGLELEKQDDDFVEEALERLCE